MAAAASGSGKPQPKDVTQDESKQLERVFNYLCDFAAKNKLFKEREPKLERKSKILAYKKNPEAVKIIDETGRELTPDEIDAELAKIDEECADITQQIENIEAKEVKRIKPRDLIEALGKLGKKSTKKEIEDMIWEVDENLDECVDWEEFQLMFHRNIKDTTGLEPHQLFNVVQFMMYDKDCGGEVSVDETMHMLYSRYGREGLQSEMQNLFGDSLSATGDARLTFEQYLAAVERKPPKSKSSKRELGGRAATGSEAASSSAAAT